MVECIVIVIRNKINGWMNERTNERRNNKQKANKKASECVKFVAIHFTH